MINIGGIVAVVFFYLLIVLVGIWAAKKGKGTESEEEVMLAGRNIGLFVGIFTMTATWVGGGYISGAAEEIFSRGLVWCQAPFGYAMSLVLGGMLFANKMREQGYVTMLDPLQDAFGERMGGMLFIPALCGEVFWSAATLSALGNTISVIVDMDFRISVVASALVAIMYTLFGGLYAVAYTDVIQLFLIFCGLWVSIPFAMNNEAVRSISSVDVDWIGSVPSDRYGQYFDCGMLLIFGGIPWQAYFQRVLSSKSASRAQLLSFVAAFGCVIMAIPSVLIGAIALATDWNMTAYDSSTPLPWNRPGEDGGAAMVLPMVLQYLTPAYVSFCGLGAVSAATMSSADSSVLGASSMFARNVYRLIFRPRASEHEIMWVMKVSIFVTGAMATIMALMVPSIYALWYLCSDLVYVILFPQLLMVVHFKRHCNTYGSVASYVIGLLVRLSGGEYMIGLPALIHYPNYIELPVIVGKEHEIRPFEQLFPFRTLAMFLSLVSVVFFSWVSRVLFESGRLPAKYDFLRCVINIPEDAVPVEEPHEGEMAVMSSMEVRHYSATDERNGRVNPALNLGSDSDDDLNDASDAGGAAQRIRRLSKSGAGAFRDLPSAQRLINRKLSLSKLTSTAAPTPPPPQPASDNSKGLADKTSAL